MKRNNNLPKIKDFKNVQHFYDHLFKLLVILYPTASIVDKTISFQDPNNKGISIRIIGTALYPNLNEEFRRNNIRFRKSGVQQFIETNTAYQWTGGTGKGYMYPRDRDMFEDSELGMEQKANYFIVIIQVLLQYLKPQ